MATDNGEIEYIGYLSASYDSNSLISNFDFEWTKIKDTVDRDVTLNFKYTGIINADYDDGITPYKIETITDGETIETIVGFSHDATRPVFSESEGSILNRYQVSYSENEKTALSNVFEKQSFDETYDEMIDNIAKNLFNTMTLNTNQNFVFNKYKTKQINLDDLSIFDRDEAQTTETTSFPTTTTITTTFSEGSSY